MSTLVTAIVYTINQSSLHQTITLFIGNVNVG